MSRSRQRSWLPGLIMLAGMGSACIWSGCRTVPPPAPVDLSAPGWRVELGQAVWKPPGRRPELAGELLVAQNAQGHTYVQFAKPPFNLVVAQQDGASWSIEFGQGQRCYRGHGEPPRAFVWFELPRWVSGTPPHAPWSSRQEQDHWRLERKSGTEWLEGRFDSR